MTTRATLNLKFSRTFSKNRHPRKHKLYYFSPQKLVHLHAFPLQEVKPSADH